MNNEAAGQLRESGIGLNTTRQDLDDIGVLINLTSMTRR
jgi:hypothetical protein